MFGSFSTHLYIRVLQYLILRIIITDSFQAQSLPLSQFHFLLPLKLIAIYKHNYSDTVIPVSLLPHSPLLVYLQRHDSYYTKFSSQDSHMEGVDFGFLQDYDVQDTQDKKARQDINYRQTFYNDANNFPGRNSSQDLYEDSTREVSAYNSSKNHKMGKGNKRGVEGMRSYSTSNHRDHYEDDIAVKPTDILLLEYDNIDPKNVQRSEHVKSKPSNSIRKSRVPMDPEERGLSTRMAKVH